MVYAEFRLTNGKYSNFKIFDHTGSTFEEKLVCSAISGVVFGILNSFDKLCYSKIKIIKKNNFIEIKSVDNFFLTSIIFKILYISLNTIKESNEELINIKVIKNDEIKI